MTPRRCTLDILALSLVVIASLFALPARAAVFVYSCVRPSVGSGAEERPRGLTTPRAHPLAEVQNSAVSCTW
jgi:hypothetical protein